MRSLAALLFTILILSVFTACTTSYHGSFTASTSHGCQPGQGPKMLGRVMGKSCQTSALYLFPVGPAPSTFEAVQMAKKQFDGTSYLSEISIDDRTEWRIGYAIQCIIVDAIAYQ